MIRSSKSISALIGIIAFIIPLSLYALWIYGCNQTSGYPENVPLYDSYLPDFLQGRFTTAIVSFVLCLIAVLLNGNNRDNQNPVLIGFFLFVVIVGSLLTLLNLFSVM